MTGAPGERNSLTVAEAVNQCTILIVDDSENTRDMLAAYLEGHNIEVLTAVNGREGIERAIEHKPDLIVMDLMMPEQDGLQSLDMLAENPETQEIPVIIISGKGSRLDQVLSLDKGAYYYLEKPFDLSEIVKKANELVGTD
jgi:two-component system alkaline phosphatase synthesis response regulator PhoP